MIVASSLRKRARAWFSLAVLALAFAALSPTANALRAGSQSKLFVALCTSMGLVQVQVGDQPDPLDHASASGPECSWCLQPGTLLALDGVVPLAVTAVAGRTPASPITFTVFAAKPPHTFARSRAPPKHS